MKFREHFQNIQRRSVVNIDLVEDHFSLGVGHAEEPGQLGGGVGAVEGGDPAARPRPAQHHHRVVGTSRQHHA